MTALDEGRKRPQIQPFAHLLSYMRFIGRVADVADLESLLGGANRTHGSGPVAVQQTRVAFDRLHVK